MPPGIRGDLVAEQQWKAKRRREIAGKSDGIGWSNPDEIEHDALNSVRFLDERGNEIRWATQARWHDEIGLSDEGLEAEMIDAPEGWRR